MNREERKIVGYISPILGKGGGAEKIEFYDDGTTAFSDDRQKERYSEMGLLLDEEHLEKFHRYAKKTEETLEGKLEEAKKNDDKEAMLAAKKALDIMKKEMPEIDVIYNRPMPVVFPSTKKDKAFVEGAFFQKIFVKKEFPLWDQEKYEFVDLSQEKGYWEM
jgi:hypothetical protein